MGSATSDFGESMFPLASAELNHNLSTHLKVLGEIQKQMKALHEQQAQYDIITLENTIDEYIRIIGSIRVSRITDDPKTIILTDPKKIIDCL